MLGKLLAAPIRILNAPLDIAERAICKVADVPHETRDGVLSGPLELLAESVEETADKIVADDAR